VRGTKGTHDYGKRVWLASNNNHDSCCRHEIA
jgi:hypothetical protein